MNRLPLTLFALSSGLLLYVIAGYPLLLAMLTRFLRNPVRTAAILPSVAMIIPVRDAEAYIHRKLDSVLALDYPRELTEVLVISDGSVDATDEIVRSYAPWDVRLLSVPKGGKAAALNDGVPTLRSSILVLSDVWQILEPGSVREMMKNFADPAVGMVSGDVVMHGADGRADIRNLSMFASVESWFSERLSDLDSLLGSSGPFYGVRRPLMPKIPTDTLLDDLYVAMAVFFRGFRVVVDPAAFAFDNAFAVDTDFSDKVRAQAGDFQMMKRYPGLMNSLNRMRFHYLSYKVARLLLPVALIIIAVTSFQFHARRVMIGALAAQAVVYGLAIIHPWLGEVFFVKRVSAALRTFVLTAIASLFASVVLFVPVRKLWKNAGRD